MDWTNEMELRQTGCIYQYRGVMCHNKTKCSTCGWNPTVEAERKKAAREKYKEVFMGWGVHDYPEPPLWWQEEHYMDDDEPDEDETDIDDFEY